MSAGAIAGGVSAALSSSSDNDDEILAKDVSKFICQILPKLDKKAIINRDRKLSEAFCLLWHNRMLGTVDGRQSSNKLISCTYAAVILDLWAAGKIDIAPQSGSGKDECAKALVKVVHSSETGTVLDLAGFKDILAHHKEGKTRNLKEWVAKCVKCHPDDHCASVILDSFVKKGIIGKEEKWFGLKKTYPTKDKEPQLELVLEIRKISLKGAEPDGYMSALLPLLRFADNLHTAEDPMLGRHYNQAEYETAKPRFEEILSNSGYKGLKN